MSKIYYNSFGTKFEVVKVNLDNCEKISEWLSNNNLEASVIKKGDTLQLLDRSLNDGEMPNYSDDILEIPKGSQGYFALDVDQKHVYRIDSKGPKNSGLRPQHYLMQLFEYKHLPEHLQIISKPICELAHNLDRTLPDNPEKSVALRKLRECKDCAVTARLFK